MADELFHRANGALGQRFVAGDDEEVAAWDAVADDRRAGPELANDAPLKICKLARDLKRLASLMSKGHYLHDFYAVLRLAERTQITAAVLGCNQVLARVPVLRSTIGRLIPARRIT